MLATFPKFYVRGDKPSIWGLGGLGTVVPAIVLGKPASGESLRAPPGRFNDGPLVRFFVRRRVFRLSITNLGPKPRRCTEFVGAAPSGNVTIIQTPLSSAYVGAMRIIRPVANSAYGKQGGGGFRRLMRIVVTITITAGRRRSRELDADHLLTLLLSRVRPWKTTGAASEPEGGADF